MVALLAMLEVAAYLLMEKKRIFDKGAISASSK